MFSLGHFLTLSSFGESHGTAYGGIISNFPAGIKLNLDLVQVALDRRKPGQSHITTARKEEDQVEFLSGIYEGKSTGAPISFIVKNKDTRSSDYKNIETNFRPSHADYTYEKKFGIRDPRGGGRSSARETLNWVVAGALAKHILPENLAIYSYVSQVGDIIMPSMPDINDDFYLKIESSPVRCPDAMISKKMEDLIQEVKIEGDSLGGVVETQIKHVPIGLGEPVFGKLHAALGHAMLSINACHGFEFGSGFAAASMRGSEHNDEFREDFSTRTNFSGGIQGGISNGMDIYFRVAFKPVASISKVQNFVNKEGVLSPNGIVGRHDPCVVPRAVPIVEHLAAFILADFYLINKIRK